MKSDTGMVYILFGGVLHKLLQSIKFSAKGNTKQKDYKLA